MSTTLMQFNAAAMLARAPARAFWGGGMIREVKVRDNGVEWSAEGTRLLITTGASPWRTA
ncbi:MAG: hypothetical protein K2L14_00750 [Duncaniella sp.]|nr:hypothetical protein [Duncaniella sp.]